MGFDFGVSGEETNVASGWISAARGAGLTGSDVQVGDSVFYALIAVMHAPEWVSSVGTDNDDFACVSIPKDADSLRRAAKLGKRIADLSDPLRDVAGVTKGKIRADLAKIAVPDSSSEHALTAGGRNRGGKYVVGDGGAVFWDDEAGWRNVPETVWEYEVGGFQVWSKWLGYRHETRDGYVMSDGHIKSFTKLCRRISALVDLQEDCNDIFRKAPASPL
jgi:hypothetical protein